MNLAAPQHHRREIELGMLLMTIAMLLFPISDALAKFLTAELTPVQIGAARFLFQSLLLLPVVLVYKGGRLPPPGVRHLALGTLIGLAVIFLFSGLQYLPLANNTALFFIEPLLLTLISAVALREPVTLRQWLAVVIGLVGALIVLRPNWAAYGPAAIFPVAAGAFFAGFLALTRVVGGRDDALTLAFWTGVAATLVLLLIMGVGLIGQEPASARPIAPLMVVPSLGVWPLLLGVGAIAAATNVLTALALRRAGAGVLAPFQYLEILSATLLGWLIFSEIPDLITGLGATIIVGSGLYVFTHQGRRFNPDGPMCE
ncbi:MAG: DMT family transporter [Chromatiaceae bacterium]|nr:DMT family transporter [Chromatiaceae bacterium]MCF7994382.1 DMT family transporter [Chromatiaceae bacterium]MCF8015279.1 DMT family transporter [Chromatiaceae bacterium]